MKSFKWICCISIVLAILSPINVTYAKDRANQKPLPGMPKHRKIINSKDFGKILADHQLWFRSSGKAGKRANFENANLKGANFKKADLRGANFQDAELVETNLQEAYLSWADFRGATLWRTNLQKANLEEANFQKANLQGANLQKANLRRANLQEAYLRRANLHEANLGNANLQEANLQEANLQETFITGASLKGCLLYGVKNLPSTNYEPKAGSTPYIPSIADAPWLKNLSYKSKVHGLVDLRGGFKKLGYRQQEREITYAIRHTQTRNNISGNALNGAPQRADMRYLQIIQGYFKLIAFEWTCKWGMSPGRPLLILVVLIILFTIPYAQSISGDIYGKKKTDGIWKVWIPGRMRDDLGRKSTKELLDIISPKCLLYGFHFSILSAFHVGWRDLNIGNWITRIQPSEYRLQATGWARVVSGIQSLISVYLMALSVLTYFGRPFDSY